MPAFCKNYHTPPQTADEYEVYQCDNLIFYYILKGLMTLSNSEKKDRYAIYVKTDTIEKADRLTKIDGAKSRSEFIENAINFYAGFVSASDCLDYYPVDYSQ